MNDILLLLRRMTFTNDDLHVHCIYHYLTVSYGGWGTDSLSPLYSHPSFYDLSKFKFNEWESINQWSLSTTFPLLSILRSSSITRELGTRTFTSCVLSAPEHLQSGSTTRNYNQSTNQHLAIIISIHDEALSIQLFSFYYLHQMFFFVPVLVTIHEVLRRLWLVYKDVVT